MTKFTDPTKQFFDFYSLSLLRFFAGKKSLNHESRIKRIEESFEKVVDDFYEEILHALKYSLIREFRHFYVEADFNFSKDQQLNTDLYRLSEKFSDIFEERGVVERDTGNLYNMKVFNRYFADKYIRQALCAFRDFPWNDGYGGELWAIGAKFALQKPQTTEEKELWIDRVLDLQHNNGNLLNKTQFSRLSEEFHNVKARKVDYPETILDYRRYAETISDLSVYASRKTHHLVTANMNFIPKIIR